MKHQLHLAPHHSFHSPQGNLERALERWFVTPQAAFALPYMAWLSGCDFWEAENREERLLRVC